MKVLWIPIVLMLSYAMSAKTSERYTQDPVTYTKNVLPLFQAHCITCHSGLLNYDVALAQKDKILKKVSSLNKQMPPQYVGTRLTVGEVDLIKQWVKTGAKK